MTHKLLLLTSLLLISGMATAQDTSNKVSTNVEIPTAPNASATPRPKQISGGVLNGKAISLPKPVYPSEARVNNISGTVTVQVIIDESGNVLSAEAKSGPVVLQSVAVEAAKLAKFTPTTLEGQPVKVSGVITYNFLSPEISARNNSQDAAFGVGIIFSFVANVDPQFFSTLGADEALNESLTDLIKEMPEEIAEAKPIMERLLNAKGTERASLINDLFQVLKGASSEDEIWSCDSGIELGKVMALVFAYANGASETLDKATLTVHLDNLKGRAISAPADVNKELIVRIKRVTDIENKYPVGSEVWIEKVLEVLDPILDGLENR